MQNYSDFREYEDSDRQPGDFVDGYRIHYEALDGKLYSPFMRAPSTTDISPDKSLAVMPKGVNHSITEHGYYYWPTLKAAVHYLDFTLRRLANLPIPKGRLRIDKVRGVEKERSTHDIREGNIMEDMEIVKEDIDISEF